MSTEFQEFVIDQKIFVILQLGVRINQTLTCLEKQIKQPIKPLLMNLAKKMKMFAQDIESGKISTVQESNLEYAIDSSVVIDILPTIDLETETK